MTRNRLSYALSGFLALGVLANAACEDLEVSDHNSEFRSVPTIERAITIETAPTIAAAATTTQFEGFEQAPATEKFEGFEQAPTITQTEGYKQAPTATKFDGFSEGNPCETFLENPTRKNSEDAVEWAMERLDGHGEEIDPKDEVGVNAACEAVLGSLP